MDLTLLSFLGGLVGARIFFVAENLSAFLSLEKILLINKYPGLSFWGGFLGGWLGLYFFSRKFKMDFAMMADIAAVGFLGGLILGNLGCFLGSCAVGQPSNLFLATPMVGVIGRRFPVQLLEALLLSLVLMRIWGRATHFHPRGLILASSLIYIGAVKLLLEPVKDTHSEWIFSLTLLTLGIYIFYRVQAGKRTLFSDTKAFFQFIASLLTDASVRHQILDHWKKSWYNQKIAISWKMRGLGKLLRRKGVKVAP